MLPAEICSLQRGVVNPERTGVGWGVGRVGGGAGASVCNPEASRELEAAAHNMQNFVLLLLPS